ncbi:hypothetical protein [Candidatus Phytoplasma pyri]|uniref:hypothetical protein n=1 Tax=Candidatus Phytoplasma pyri TaxID=47566 RepID=UPI003983BE6E
MFKLLEILVIIMFILVLMLNVIYVIQTTKNNDSLTSISQTLNIGILFLIVMYLICLNFKLDFKGPSEPNDAEPQTIKVVYEGLK